MNTAYFPSNTESHFHREVAVTKEVIDPETGNVVATSLEIMTLCAKSVSYSSRTVRMPIEWAMRIGTPCAECYEKADLPR